MRGFPEALRAMLDFPSQSFRRASWRPDKRVYYVFADGKLPHLEITTADGDAPYVPSQCDMRAADWVLCNGGGDGAVVMKDTSVEFTHLFAAKKKAERERDDARADCAELEAPASARCSEKEFIADENAVLAAAPRKASEALGNMHRSLVELMHVQQYAKGFSNGVAHHGVEEAEYLHHGIMDECKATLSDARAAMADAEKALGGALPATEAHHG